MSIRHVILVPMVIALTLFAGCETVTLTPTSTPERQAVATAVPPTVTPTSATATATTGPAPATGSSGGVIAFTSYRDDASNAEIYVMNADGTNQRRLTDNPAVDVASDWSPDGKRIAFMSNRDGDFEIYVMAADGTGQQRLTSSKGDDFWPVWSPDGAHIAFSSQRDGNDEIYVTNADGSDQRRLTNHAAEDHDPAWSPDGTQIAFASDRDGNSEIYVMDVDGAEPGSANVRRLTNNPAVDTDPAWSPDGTRIAFMSGPMGDFRIYIMDIDGSDVTQLPIGDGDGWSPAWSPDGTQIAFYSYRPGPYRDNKPVAIYVVSVDGAEPGSGDLRQLTDPATRSFHPIWRPSPPEIDVPPGPAPTLDGVIAPGEWDDARREQLTDGSELLLLHANGYLYVGIRANTKSTITGNIYVYRGDEIDILHSSAALGTATYERAQDGWQRTQDFVWRCRATTNSPTAQKERETFLQEEHWVANNGRMGTPGELEYQIEMPEGSLRLAVTYRAAAPERFYWPSGLDDDCITASDGPIPEKLRFSPEKWATARAMTAASVGVPEMVLVEAGSFQMGAADGNPDGQPVHEVHITRAFYIAKHEVTFEQYDQFCDETVGKNRPADGGWGRGNRAVTAVTWYDAVAYCNWLSEHEGLAPCYSGKGRLTQCDLAATGYRLPTEAEWEYAARGAQQSQGFKYAGSDDIDDVAWYGTPGGYAHPVGQKQPNELGLYDMSGNVWEWCWDLHGEGYYASAPASDPTGPASGSTRVRRGGGFKDDADSHGTTYRSFDGPTYLGPSNGFRLVRTK